MVQYNPKLWLRLIFQFHKSDTFRILMPAILGIGVYSAVIAYLELEVFHFRYHATTIIHSLLGLVLSLLLVFRTNSAYDRWWEGRKLWGSLLNNSRNLALKLDAILPEDAKEEKQRWAENIISYAHVLKDHLRGHKSTFRPDLPKDAHQPNYMAGLMIKEAHKLYKSGQISGEQLLFLNNELQSFADICGGCERIKRTPIPFAYGLFIKKFIFVYIITIPFSFIPDYKYAIIPIVMFIFYVLTSLELIAEEIEEPFGKDANDLPIDSITESVKLSVSEILD